LFHIERATECIRVRISKRSNFTIKNAFSYTDKDFDGYLSQNDVREMLSEHGFFATERELNSIMHKFDKDRDMKISFSEFIDELTPKI
jgi:Ca2+-binding EF-hand superfamily protein